MAIPYRPKPLTSPQCCKGYYGALIHVSMGYSPVKGRFHTRCAPVRRSSAECKHSLLPLDLHVLGLPLAFILSQDQTLHCKIICTSRLGYVFYNLILLLFITNMSMIFFISSCARKLITCGLQM